MTNIAFATTIACGTRQSVIVAYDDLVNLLRNYSLELFFGLIFFVLSIHILYLFYKLLIKKEKITLLKILIFVIEYVILIQLLLFNWSIISISPEACLDLYSDGTQALNFYKNITRQILAFENNASILATFTVSVATGLFIIIKGINYITINGKK